MYINKLVYRKFYVYGTYYDCQNIIVWDLFLENTH